MGLPLMPCHWSSNVFIGAINRGPEQPAAMVWACLSQEPSCKIQVVLFQRLAWWDRVVLSPFASLRLRQS